MPHENHQNLRPVIATKEAARKELEKGPTEPPLHRRTYHGCPIDNQGKEQGATTYTNHSALSARDLHERHNRTSCRVPTAQTNPATHPLLDLQARHGHHEQMFRHEQRRQPSGDTWTVLAAAYVQDRKILFSDSRACVQDGKVIIAEHVHGGHSASDRHTPRRRHSVHGHLTSHVSDVTKDKDRSQQDIMRTAVRDLFNQGRSEARHVTNVAVRRTSDDSPADGIERTKENSKLSLLAEARTRLREVEPLRVEIQNLESQSAKLDETYQRVWQESRDVQSPAGAFIDDDQLEHSINAPREIKERLDEVKSKLTKARASLQNRLLERHKSLDWHQRNLKRRAQEASGSKHSLIELMIQDALAARHECYQEYRPIVNARTDLPMQYNSFASVVHYNMYKEFPDLLVTDPVVKTCNLGVCH